MPHLARATTRFLWAIIGMLSLLRPCALQAQTSLFDPSFHIGSGPDGPVYAVLVQPDGKIMIGGEFTNFSGLPQPYLARLHPDGRLDTSFGLGTDGVVNRLLQLSDGRILVAGYFTHLQGADRHSLGRLLTNGVVDLSFDANAAYATDEIVRTVALQPDGKILTASETNVLYWPRTRLSRLGPDGELDTSFTRIAADNSCYALLSLPGGKILAAGGFFGTGPSGGLSLLHHDGQRDTNFPTLFTNYTTVLSLTRLTNGNILVGGGLNRIDAARPRVLAQLTPEWKWDKTFDAGEFNGWQGGYVRAALVQPDGKIVITGDFYGAQGYWRRHIARLDATGVIDPCFDPTLGLGGQYGAHALALQNDGCVVVGGQFENSGWNGYCGLARLLPKSDCSMIRAFVVRGDSYGIYASCPPGGTNYIQMSTNLIDWVTLETSKDPYFCSYVSPDSERVFFRVRKDY